MFPVLEPKQIIYNFASKRVIMDTIQKSKLKKQKMILDFKYVGRIEKEFLFDT